MLKQMPRRRMPSVKMTPMAHQNAESAARATVMAVTAENAMPILTTTQAQPLVKTHQLKSLPVQVKHKRKRPSRAPTLIALQALQCLLHRLQILALSLLRPAHRHKLHLHLHLHLNQNLQPRRPQQAYPKFKPLNCLLPV